MKVLGNLCNSLWINFLLKNAATYSGLVESIFRLSRGGILRRYEAGGGTGNESCESSFREMHVFGVEKVVLVEL